MYLGIYNFFKTLRPKYDDVIKVEEAFSVLLALCEGNSPATGEFHSQRPVT